MTGGMRGRSCVQGHFRDIKDISKGNTGRISCLSTEQDRGPIFSHEGAGRSAQQKGSPKKTMILAEHLLGVSVGKISKRCFTNQ